jgi:hypothetical protein
MTSQIIDQFKVDFFFPPLSHLLLQSTFLSVIVWNLRFWFSKVCRKENNRKNYNYTLWHVSTVVCKWQRLAHCKLSQLINPQNFFYKQMSQSRQCISWKLTDGISCVPVSITVVFSVFWPNIVLTTPFSTSRSCNFSLRNHHQRQGT